MSKVQTFEAANLLGAASTGSDNSGADVPMNQTEIDTFNASLKDALPSLRVYALSLTRDRDRADKSGPADLAQGSGRPRVVSSRHEFRGLDLPH